MTPRSRPVPRTPSFLLREAGTTLTEVLATLAILGLVLAALVPLLSIAGQSWHRVDRHTDMLQNARRAADTMVRDLRAAQGFLIVDPSLPLMRFVTARGDGTGQMLDVEYRLNSATGTLEYRQRSETGFLYRRRIVIVAPNGVPAGYSVPVTFDHQALVQSGKSLANGNDVRIRYWTGTEWVELDRVLDIQSTWNTTTTRVWFRLQAPIPSGGTSVHYFLHYGDLGAGPPPANADNVFLDYEEGTADTGWVRRDSGTNPCNGTDSIAADTNPVGTSFRFANTGGAQAGLCYREFSKWLPGHANVEVFWRFRSDSGGGAATQRHIVGISARRSSAGAGYRLNPGQATNTRLRIYRVAGWGGSGAGTQLAEAPLTVAPGTNYYGRFSLVGAVLRGKTWAVGQPEPLGWAVAVTDPAPILSGDYYGRVNGLQRRPIDHRHRYIIVRARVADPEPSALLAAEETPASLGAFQPLAGPFQSMSIRCFNASGGLITGCAPVSEVRSVEVSLTLADPTGEVLTFAVTSRASRQVP
ncbi:MAG: hypothetical protein QN168_13650 [Armatimonadota bacterium]|nr:hypothetical protein [Armatimonadota bacterium]